MTYVDGFVLPIAKKNLPAYKKMAKIGSKVWMEHGALQYLEAVGDDLDLPFGLPYPKGLKLKKGETVVFAWIAYKSRAHRKRVMANAMKDPRLTESMTKKMPFDVKRMMCGGFQSIVEAP